MQVKGNLEPQHIDDVCKILNDTTSEALKSISCDDLFKELFVTRVNSALEECVAIIRAQNISVLRATRDGLFTLLQPNKVNKVAPVLLSGKLTLDGNRHWLEYKQIGNQDIGNYTYNGSIDELSPLTTRHIALMVIERAAVKIKQSELLLSETGKAVKSSIKTTLALATGSTDPVCVKTSTYFEPVK
ncbi:hypothetical protein VCHA53O466_140025 [Vibrio chagasii]|nr:hypothetical protein VCHA53O466_140025 [Vibrio chagasii]